MSVQFGRWNFDGKPIDRDYLEKVSPLLAPYGPDGAGSYSKENISILYRAFHTTKESRRESQPHSTLSGSVITWHGRLDNREELIGRLHDSVTAASTDVEIVSSAYECWREACFAKLIGDWAVSIWDAKSDSLILAKDPIGSRHLYYSIEKDQLTWSTILDPLVLFAGRTFALNEEYIAGFLSFFPASHLTPYVGIHSVPPSNYVLIQRGTPTIRKYWELDPSKRIRYRTDAQYEEHFRAVFAEAVRRRLRSDTPILSELSGGMDSSSIVCVADTILARGAAEAPRLDTISFYDDSEPNWNERPYFTKVEEERGRTGTHIDVGQQETLNLGLDSSHFAATPGSNRGRYSEIRRQIAACFVSQGNRVLLSGIGGDEFTGGVPTPTAELQDLLARGHFTNLAHQLKVWALHKRKPWFHLFFDAAQGFFPTVLVGTPKYKRPPAWLNPDFVKRNRPALTGYPQRTKTFSSLPSFQANVSTLEALRRQLSCSDLSPDSLHEKRYPYLDCNLLEFLSAIPREQLVRPGHRRSLMRRGLSGIVPAELLNRKRKAFVVRSPLVSVRDAWSQLLELGQRMLLCSLRIADSTRFVESLEKIRQGAEVPIVPFMRTLAVEFWLRSLSPWQVLDHGPGLRSGPPGEAVPQSDPSGWIASNVN